MAVCLPCMATGPFLITLSFLNDNRLFILLPGLLFATLAIYFGFKGIFLILKSVFAQGGSPSIIDRDDK